MSYFQTKFYREFQLEGHAYCIYIYNEHPNHVHLYRENLQLKSRWSWVVSYNIDKNNQIDGISESSGLHEPENDTRLKAAIQAQLDKKIDPMIQTKILGTIANYDVTLFTYKNGQKVYEIYCSGDPNGVSLTQEELDQLFILTRGTNA